MTSQRTNGSANGSITSDLDGTFPSKYAEVQRRLDEHPGKMRQRREMVEHPFGTIKARMGATHFLMKTLPRVIEKIVWLAKDADILFIEATFLESCG
jgi:hypothetical protein